MTTYICKCGRRVKKSTDASTTGNRLSGYAPGHECWGCPYAMPYGNYQWDESARTVSRETQGYECRMSKTLTYASEFAGSIKDKCTCRVHSLDFDFLSQVSAYGSFNSGGEALAVDTALKVSGAAADAKATGDALAGKAAASHTHNYAGSSSAGGVANSANKLNKNAGSATQGVYFKDGVPVAMTYTLGKSVPADAKFTDTNTWRGVQDNLTSTATDQSLSANQGKVLKGLVDGKAASSHTHDDRYYTESEMNTKLNGKANSSHTHNYAGSGSAGGTANSVNGLTFAAQTTDPGAGSALTTNKVLIVYV